MIIDTLKKKFKAIHFLIVFISILVLYIMWLFFYLKIVGVYGVAVINKAVATSEGVDYTYEFFYEKEKYNGTFTGLTHQIGEKYFVLFSKKDPARNLLQYDTPVPNCLKDSINDYWVSLPQFP